MSRTTPRRNAARRWPFPAGFPILAAAQHPGGHRLAEETSAQRSAPLRPLSSRICRGVCLLGATWTLCAHLVVALGGSLFWVILGFALACAAWVFAAKRMAPPQPTTETTPGAGSSTERDRLLLRIGGGVTALAAVVSFGLTESVAALWLAGLGALVLGALTLPRLPSPAPPATGSEAPLLALALACAVWALLLHRPEASDALFVSLAIGAEGRMDLPLLAIDTLHGRDDLALFDSLHRLRSHELLVAALAWITRVEPLLIFHWGVAAAGAFLIPLAHAELFRRLTPRYWLASTAALVAVLAFGGETLHAYGGFAFPRIWQGDALLVSVFVPLLLVHAADFAERPDARRFGLLFATQVAAIGCSGDAVWIAPPVVLAGLLSATPLTYSGALRVARGLAPSLYGIGAMFAVGAAVGSAPGELALTDRLAADLRRALGDGPPALAALLASLGAWACLPAGVGRRFAVFAPLVAWIVGLGPLVSEALPPDLARAETWRAFWALPACILLSLLVVSPLQHPLSPGLRHAGVALLAIGLLFVLPSSVGRPGDADTLGAPVLKVPTGAYAEAQQLHAHAAGQRVVAPPEVSIWLPTFRNPAAPLLVAPYLDAARIGNTAYRDRYVMTHYAGGEVRHVEARKLFARGLELYGVDAALIRMSEHIENARLLLRRAGYERRVQASAYEIWVRSESPAR